MSGWLPKPRLTHWGHRFQIVLQLLDVVLQFLRVRRGVHSVLLNRSWGKNKWPHMRINSNKCMSHMYGLTVWSYRLNCTIFKLNKFINKNSFSWKTDWQPTIFSIYLNQLHIDLSCSQWRRFISSISTVAYKNTWHAPVFKVWFRFTLSFQSFRHKWLTILLGFKKCK